MEIPDKPKKISKKQMEPEPQSNLQFFTVQAQSNSSFQQFQATTLSFQNNFKELLTSWIPKKTMNMAWQERYFTLTPTRIIYYTSKDKSEVKGCFNLISLREHHISVFAQYPILSLAVSLKSSKEIKEEKQLLKLNIQNKEEFTQWMVRIRQILEDTENNNPKLYPTIQEELVRNPQPKVTTVNFWNKITLSIQQLHSYASHLDIIFFRSKNSGSKFQRLLMRSYFDHVGILLKNELDKIFVLEAIESRGVWVNEWSELLPSIKDVYQEIGYRKLILPKNGNKIDQTQLQSYLNSLLGKKYELSLTKLIGNEEQESKEEKKQKTYFCSELIADIYIKFGLIKNRKKNDFWPRDFQHSIHLQSGAELSPLMDIQI